jgi:predicted HAD superfamily Cof-like phosphohydrolase
MEMSQELILEKTNFKKVIDWNITFGIIVNTKPQTDIFKKNPKLVKYRMELIREELRELMEGVGNHDMAEVYDALCDLLVVIYGAKATFGLMSNDILYDKNLSTKTNFQKVIELNKTKNIAVNVSPQINIFNEKQELVKYWEDIIQDIMIRLEISISSYNMDNVNHYLNDLLVAIYGTGASFGLDLDEGLDLVNKSNMSKSCSSEEQAKKTIEWYKNNDDRYDSPTYRKSPLGQYWVIFNESTGKILKSIDWKIVDFKKILEIKNQKNK